MNKPFVTTVVFGIFLAISAHSASAGMNRTCQGSELEVEKCLSKIYIDKMAAEKGATVVEGGVVIRPIFTNDRGSQPRETDTVAVSYHLVDRTGKLIETSAGDDELAVFPLERLIQCWKIAIPKMTTGSVLKVTCPSDTAYGDKGAGDDIKGGAAITFRISLFGIGQPLRANSRLVRRYRR